MARDPREAKCLGPSPVSSVFLYYFQQSSPLEWIDHHARQIWVKRKPLTANFIIFCCCFFVRICTFALSSGDRKRHGLILIEQLVPAPGLSRPLGIYSTTPETCRPFSRQQDPRASQISRSRLYRMDIYLLKSGVFGLRLPLLDGPGT